MAYGNESLEKRLKENIRTYTLDSLYDLEKVEQLFKSLCEAFHMELLLTQRHGETAVEAGDFTGFTPDVVKAPGYKWRVADRTIGHLYVRYKDPERRQEAEAVLEGVLGLYVSMGERQYRYRETAIYADELEEKLEKEQYRTKHGEHLDALTGLPNKTYFDGRLKELELDGAAPDAVICVNINDWKYANDHFGDEESDRLIRIVAALLKREAGPGYVIGRTDGDVFGVVIEGPMEGEAEAYCARVKQACEAYDDPVLAPSVAVGVVYRTNVEESFAELYSEAEFEMFRDKLTEKSKPGYRERLLHQS